MIHHHPLRFQWSDHDRFSRICLWPFRCIEHAVGPDFKARRWLQLFSCEGQSLSLCFMVAKRTWRWKVLTNEFFSLLAEWLSGRSHHRLPAGVWLSQNQSRGEKWSRIHPGNLWSVFFATMSFMKAFSRKILECARTRRTSLGSETGAVYGSCIVYFGSTFSHFYLPDLTCWKSTLLSLGFIAGGGCLLPGPASQDQWSKQDASFDQQGSQRNGQE